MKLGAALAFPALAALALLLCSACAATVPKAEIDRCTLGVADGNEAMTTRQGAACTQVAQRLAAAEQPLAALGYARKACDFEDARGCEEYLALARAQPGLGGDQLQRARAAGEKACAGMVLAVGGVADARPALCARTAELYEDVQPSSREDAARLFARACKLGDDPSCPRARALGAETSDHVVLGPKSAPNATTAAQPLPPPGPRPPSIVPLPSPSLPCHEMRTCVALDVQQRNMSEVVGSIANHCDRAVACTWCPAHRAEVDKSGCRSTTLAPGEARAGREAGLWYDGFDSIAYDCADANDARACLAM